MEWEYIFTSKSLGKVMKRCEKQLNTLPVSERLVSVTITHQQACFNPEHLVAGCACNQVWHGAVRVSTD
jgi:hypothetical protein